MQAAQSGPPGRLTRPGDNLSVRNPFSHRSTDEEQLDRALSTEGVRTGSPPAMLAFRALPALVIAGPTPERQRHPILASLMPALDTAFGLEHPVLFPDPIAALVTKLEEALDTLPAEADFVFLEAA